MTDPASSGHSGTPEPGLHPKAYIILAHDKPAQLFRLVSRLDDGASSFFVHLDRSKDLAEFTALPWADNVTFIERRFDSWWASFGLVEAVLALLEQAVRPAGAGHIILLSGADYPLRSAGEIARFLEARKDVNFLTCVPVEDRWPRYEWKSRLHYYVYHLSGRKSDMVVVPPLLSRDILRPGKLPRFVRHLLRGDFSRDFLRRVVTRRKPLGFRLYGGSQWFGLTQDTARDTLRFLESTPEFMEFFRYTRCSDEIFFQTAVKAVATDNSRVVIEESLTYARWEKSNDPSPITFRTEHLPELLGKAAEFVFARKFDLETCGEIVDLIDRNAGKDCPSPAQG